MYLLKCNGMAWERKINEKIIVYQKNFRATAIMGIRQSGKTTICKTIFADYQYFNFENITTQKFSLDEPLDFLNINTNGAIYDEIQRVPHLFNYLQEILDNTTERGKYVLTGNSNFLLNEKITQSLACIL
jgi:uncharacterized protein